jgi:hypothetical protein
VGKGDGAVNFIQRLLLATACLLFSAWATMELLPHGNLRFLALIPSGITLWMFHRAFVRPTSSVSQKPSLVGPLAYIVPSGIVLLSIPFTGVKWFHILAVLSFSFGFFLLHELRRANAAPPSWRDVGKGDRR